MCTCWSQRIRLARCLRRCGSEANRMCKPSTSDTGAAEPCDRGGSSPAWCRPNGRCRRFCATSTQSGTRPHGGIANRVPLVKRAHASGACEKPAHHVARGLSASWLRCSRAGIFLCKMASCGSSPRGRTFNPPSPHAGARLGRLALPGDGGACIGQTNDVPTARSPCRGDSGWLIASVPLNALYI